MRESMKAMWPRGRRASSAVRLNKAVGLQAKFDGIVIGRNLS